jgi:cyclopropane fatty-acyl-phospholipid synthase-like methyltransferase
MTAEKSNSSAAPESDARQYDTTYSQFTTELYKGIRRETFGEDIGQNSWRSADEMRTFYDWLKLAPSNHLLELASGSGGPALFAAKTTGCRVTGVDIHEAGIAAGNKASEERGLFGRVRFLKTDARERLPFTAGGFDGAICIDAINHPYERGVVLRECFRVLRAGGRLFFTDPITVTGMLRRDEMILRSAGVGEFVVTPPGLDKRQIEEAGFEVERVEDLTEGTARIALNWLDARRKRSEDLDKLEGEEQNESVQKHLAAAEKLAREHRLSRFAYLAIRPGHP